MKSFVELLSKYFQWLASSIKIKSLLPPFMWHFEHCNNWNTMCSKTNYVTDMFLVSKWEIYSTNCFHWICLYYYWVYHINEIRLFISLRQSQIGLFIFWLLLFLILINIAAINIEEKIIQQQINFSIEVRTLMTKWCCRWRQNAIFVKNGSGFSEAAHCITPQCRRSEMKLAAKFKLAAVEYDIWRILYTLFVIRIENLDPCKLLSPPTDKNWTTEKKTDNVVNALFSPFGECKPKNVSDVHNGPKEMEDGLVWDEKCSKTTNNNIMSAELQSNRIYWGLFRLGSQMFVGAIKSFEWGVWCHKILPASCIQACEDWATQICRLTEHKCDKRMRAKLRIESLWNRRSLYFSTEMFMDFSWFDTYSCSAAQVHMFTIDIYSGWEFVLEVKGMNRFKTINKIMSVSIAAGRHTKSTPYFLTLAPTIFNSMQLRVSAHAVECKFHSPPENDISFFFKLQPHKRTIFWSVCL